MKGITLSALGLMLLAALAACAGQSVEIQITEENTVNVWTPGGTIHTVPLDNIVIHGIENMPTATPMPVSTSVSPAPTPYVTPARPVSVPQPESYEHWDVDRLVQIWNTLPSTNNGVILGLAADKYDGNQVLFSGSVEYIGSYYMTITVISGNDRRLSWLDISVSCHYSDAADRQYLASLITGDRVKIYGTANISLTTYRSSYKIADFMVELSECLVESVN